MQSLVKKGYTLSLKFPQKFLYSCETSEKLPIYRPYPDTPSPLMGEGRERVIIKSLTYLFILCKLRRAK
ncbi:MAG: hypothetical protein A3E19_00775 [Planctomycetes bacterium RIFCSPHIGHO2_12_FULL_52_36]|nr:MAG: hypothetical protein A3E19_00775 [Planctomycetes bacterium RIFCSPHIGHO2_12_FULL_52_36]